MVFASLKLTETPSLYKTVKLKSLIYPSNILGFEDRATHRKQN